MHSYKKSFSIHKAAVRYFCVLAVCSSQITIGAEDKAAPKRTLGLSIESRDEAEKRFMQNGFPELGSRKCVVVKTVDNNGPNAGKIAADILIISVAGKPVPDPETYDAVVAALTPGDDVEVKGFYASKGPGGKGKWSPDKVTLTVGESRIDAPVHGGEGGNAPQGNGPTSLISVSPDPVNIHLLKAKPLAFTPTLTAELAKALGVDTPDADARWADLNWPGEGAGIGNVAELKLSAITAPQFVFLTHNEDDEVAAWEFRHGSRLKIRGDKAAHVYAPFAVSPDQKYIASLDGEYVRVWECSSDSLRLHGSVTSDIDKNNNLAQGDIRSITWIDATHFLVCGWYSSNRTCQHVQRFTVGEDGVSEALTIADVNKRNGPWLMEYAEGPATAVAVTYAQEEGTQRPIESVVVRNTRTNTISKPMALNGWSTPLLPRDKHDAVYRGSGQGREPKRGGWKPYERACLRLCGDGKRVLVSVSVEEKPYVRIYDAVTLRLQGGFELEANAVLASIPKEENVALVLHTNRTERRKGWDVSHTAILYDLTTGRRMTAFPLGEEFYNLSELSLSRDGQFVFAVGSPERPVLTRRDAEADADGAAEDVASASIAVGAWNTKDGKRRVLTRRYSSQARGGAGDDVTVRLLGGSTFVYSGLKRASRSWADKPERETHFADIQDLLKVADGIMEADQCVETNDLKAAATKYRQVLEAGDVWWFRDQYPKMLCALYDYRAECGELDAAKVIAAYFESVDIKLEPRTREGSRFAQKMEDEAAARKEEARRQADVENLKRMRQFKEMREANRKKFTPATRLTRKQFVDRLDEMKTNGTKGPPTLLQFQDFVFPDVFGEPDKRLGLDVGKADIGYKCQDGWVWLRASISPPESRVVVITNIDLN